jgi:hypothetical protein
MESLDSENRRATVSYQGIAQRSAAFEPNASGVDCLRKQPKNGERFLPADVYLSVCNSHTVNLVATATAPERLAGLLYGRVPTLVAPATPTEGPGEVTMIEATASV